MPGPDRADATVMLSRSVRGDEDAAARLIELTYERLRELAAGYLRRERANHTLQATALVHEAYVRLVDPEKVSWQGRTHFLAIAAHEMRRVLVDHARQHNRLKRGGGRARVVLDEALLPTGDRGVDTLDLEQALGELSALDERQGQIVELRFFAGLTVDEVAARLGISPKTVEKDWRFARAWLHKRLKRGAEESA